MWCHVALFPLWLVTNDQVNTAACRRLGVWPVWKRKCWVIFEKHPLRSCQVRLPGSDLRLLCAALPLQLSLARWQFCEDCEMKRRCELACSARLCYSTMLTETSNSSVSAPQRDFARRQSSQQGTTDNYFHSFPAQLLLLHRDFSVHVQASHSRESA